MVIQVIIVLQWLEWLCYFMHFLPHTTHLSQPLDSCFGSLKASWWKVCQTYILLVRSVVGIYEFSCLLAEAWHTSMTIKTLQAGLKLQECFVLTGLLLNFQKIPSERQSILKLLLWNHAGLACIPLYRPVHKPRQNSPEPSSALELSIENTPYLLIMIQFT